MSTQTSARKQLKKQTTNKMELKEESPTNASPDRLQLMIEQQSQPSLRRRINTDEISSLSEDSSSRSLLGEYRKRRQHRRYPSGTEIQLGVIVGESNIAKFSTANDSDPARVCQALHSAEKANKLLSWHAGSSFSQKRRRSKSMVVKDVMRCVGIFLLPFRMLCKKKTETVELSRSSGRLA
jgi:hypothetical protein